MPLFLFLGWLGNRDCGFGGLWLGGRLCCARRAPPDQFRDIVVYGARMSFLLGDAKFRQHLEDGMRGNLELPGQFIDANFAHSYDCNGPRNRRLANLLRVLYGIRFTLLFRQIRPR